MDPWLGTAAARTGTIGVGFYAALVLRLQSRGRGDARILLIGAAPVVLSAVLAVGWQGLSRLRPWPWFTTFLGFVLTLVGVCILAVAAVRGLR